MSLFPKMSNYFFKWVLCCHVYIDIAHSSGDRVDRRECKERSKQRSRTEKKIMSTQVLIMLVCSLEVGKLLPVNHWSNSTGNRESSSALLTYSTCLPNPSSEHFRRNKHRMQPGWLDVACYTAACCWCVILYIHKRLFTHCHSLMSVSPQWGEARWHEVPEQLNSDTFQKHAHTTVELEWWERKRNGEIVCG